MGDHIEYRQSWAKQIREMEGALELEKKTLKLKDHQIEHLDDRLREIQREHHNDIEEKKVLEEDITRLQNKIKTLSETNKILVEENTDFKTSANDLSLENKRVLCDLENLTSSKLDRINHYENEIKYLEKQIQEFSDEEEKMKEKLKLREEEIETLHE